MAYKKIGNTKKFNTYQYNNGNIGTRPDKRKDANKLMLPGNVDPDTVIKYHLGDKELNRLVGMQNYFVFDIEKEIKWIDKKTNGAFDSKHYSPLVNNPPPKTLKRGTMEYEEYWDEQDSRCINGYQPIVDNVVYPRITGPHYFYLNMYQIMMLKFGDKKKKLNFPYYRTLDHMIFLELEKAGKDGYGIIVGKARRMGLSYIGSLMILWNMIFFKDNTVAVGAGLEDKALKLYEKLVKGLQTLREEYRVAYKKRKKEMIFAYDVREHKVKKEKGIMSQLDIKTFFNNPSIFEGGSYSFFIFEEIGLHDNLILSYKASEPCFREGKTQFGTPFLFGTGGEIEKGSRDFKIMYEKPGHYNMKKIFIPAYMYYPGDPDVEDDDEDANREDVNFFSVRTGMTDQKAALEHIMKRRLLARDSKEGYVKEVQSLPIKESDIFLKTSGGLLDRIALARQREAIYNKENKHTYIRGSYYWKDTEVIKPLLSRCSNTKEKNKVRIAHGIKAGFREDPNGVAYKLKGFNPINSSMLPYQPDIGGTDSYDFEEAAENKSLGASLAYRVFNSLSTEYDIPLGFLMERGDGTSEDTFFENTLLQAVYWRMEVLVEYTNIAIIGYFKDVGAHHHLRTNPDIDAKYVTNKGRQEFGVKMTSGKNGFKALVLALLKSEIKANIENYHFEQILDELMEYGDKNTDLAMALGVTLIHRLDIFKYISDDITDGYTEEDVLMDMTYWHVNNDGTTEIRTYGDNDEDEDDIETFDMRKHLYGEEREKYLNFVQKNKDRIDKEKRKREIALKEQSGTQDPFESTRRQYLNNN